MRKLKTHELNRITPQAFSESEKIPVRVILDNVRSLLNIGSVFRSSDAFCVEKIYLCGITAAPPHRDINKTALGATETVAWEKREEIFPLAQELKKEGWEIFAVEQTSNSISLEDFDPSGKKIALILGNEVKGVSYEWLPHCSGAIEIPQGGTKHSLNVSVAAGVVLWEVFHRQTLRDPNRTT